MASNSSPTKHIPEILLLCMFEQNIGAFNKALSSLWPTISDKNGENPKIKITTINNRLNAVPETNKFQLVVSPANSYGRLDGAFDDAISRAFCRPHSDYDTLTKAAQKVLYDRYRGFAPPGTCTLVPFPAEIVGKNQWGCKWVALCPTMRFPDDVRWDREVIYECVWSLLCELERWNREVTAKGKIGDRIDRILMTPLATGVGNVPQERWAEQFVLAMKHFVDALGRPDRWSSLDWGEAGKEVMETKKTWMTEQQAEESKIVYGGLRGKK